MTICNSECGAFPTPKQGAYTEADVAKKKNAKPTAVATAKPTSSGLSATTDFLLIAGAVVLAGVAIYYFSKRT